jgi:hypothetical protein
MSAMLGRKRMYWQKIDNADFLSSPALEEGNSRMLQLSILNIGIMKKMSTLE